MWQAIIEAAVIAGIYIYHRWIEEHPPGPRPAYITLPRIDEGAPIPLIYGRCRVRAPILAWSGGQRAIAVREAEFAYFMDMIFVVGTPFYGGSASLREIFINDRVSILRPAVEWETLIPGFTEPDPPFTVFPASSPMPIVPSLPRFPGDPQPSKTNFFASRTPGAVFDIVTGNISPTYGFVEFFNGSTTQLLTSGFDPDPHIVLTDTQGVLEIVPLDDIYLPTEEHAALNVWQVPTYSERHVPSDIPSYRGFATVCLYHWCHGFGTNIAAYGFEVVALSTGTASDMGRSLEFDADPAAVIYDLLTSPFGKLGLPAANVNRASFEAASLTLFNEKHGYSNALESITDAADIISEILRQIDGVLYQEPTTAQLVLKLVRNDYDVLSLFDVNPSNVIRENGVAKLNYSIQGWSETINQIRLTFVDRENSFQDQLVVGQNGANAFFQGRLRSVDLRYPGISTKALAQQVCSRELAVLSKPMVKATVVVNRQFYAHRPGDAVTFTWPALSIDRMVMRIARIDLGQLHDGQITLDLIRDVFDVSLGAFPVP